MRGAAIPPRICAPATIAATRPAIEYAVRVAVELEQVGLQGVEGVDADAAGEQRAQHQPLDRRHPPPVVDRVRGDLPHLGHRPLSLLGREADVVHEPEGDDEHHRQDGGPDQERHPEAGRLGDQAAGDRAGQHRDAGDDLPAAEDRLEVAVEAGRRERVDEPGLDRAGEEREPEPEQDRGDRPFPERRLDLPQERRRGRSRAVSVTVRADRRPGARSCRRRSRSGPRRAPCRR